MAVTRAWCADEVPQSGRHFGANVCPEGLDAAGPRLVTGKLSPSSGVLVYASVTVTP